jgi:signal transduction histidine kinase
MRPTLRLTLGIIGGVLGLLSLGIARREPGYSVAGGSAARTAAELAAGWILLAVGMIAASRRTESRFGRLLGVAGCAWFLVEWNNPGTRANLAFTVGLTFYAATPALVAHAGLAYPDGLPLAWPERLAVGLGYLDGLFLLGLLPALVFDPAAQGCGQCPRNLLLVTDSASLYGTLNSAGVHLGLIWSLTFIPLLILRLARSSTARRRLTWPVLSASAAYLGLVATEFGHEVARGTSGNDQIYRTLWLGQAAALVLLSFGVAWNWLRGRRTRSAVARLVVDLAGSPSPGALSDALARTLGDPSLRVAYPLDDGRVVDPQGRSLSVDAEATPLVRGSRQVALLFHRPGLLEDPALVEEVAAAARLALENERLQAATRAQLEDLRASRTRLVAAGDAERRRLERDLHDGAQQHLVGLMLSLRIARARMDADPNPSLRQAIEAAEAEVSIALAELRELAHGIFPAILADEGLAAALEALAEEAPIPINLVRLPDRRCDPHVEAAGYFVVLETLSRSQASSLQVDVECRDRDVEIEVECDRAPEKLVNAEDRVGALDGTVAVIHLADGRVKIRAEIPCGS